MPEPSRADKLSADRTHLANERTLLAYIRTALGFIATGVGILGFMETQVSSFWAWGSIACGIVALVIGTVRFVQVQADVRRGQADGDGD